MFKRKMSFPCLLFSILILFSACAVFNNSQQISDKEKYELAVQDAMVAEENEICSDLIAITPGNSYINWSGTEDDQRVLVVTWTKYPDSFPKDSTICNTWGEIWVTVVPEMEDWFLQNYSPGKDYVHRSEELLGLPRNKGYTHFIEMWVHPADLWRPSPDNEITDNTAQIPIPADMDSSYQNWYRDNIIYSYFPLRYPWTRLGYTYDWGNPETEIGLSEFVLKNNSQILVHNVYDNESYFGIIFENK